MTGVLMRRLLLFTVVMMLSLPILGHGAENDTKAPPAELPKGHPAVDGTKQAPPIAVANQAPPITGKVLKSMDSGGYTYVYLQQKKGQKIWVAFPKAKVTVGKKVSLVPGEEFKNFKSKTLNRTFDKIIFSLGPVPKKGAKGATQPMPMPGSKDARVAPENISVQKAVGANAYTVAELFAQKEKLSGKKIVVKGKVVKISQHIMKRNWIHLQDGTGSADKKSHDLVVTTQALPVEGQTITVTGTLLKNKDFGSGYKYDVLIDNAEIVK